MGSKLKVKNDNQQTRISTPDTLKLLYTVPCVTGIQDILDLYTW